MNSGRFKAGFSSSFFRSYPKHQFKFLSSKVNTLRINTYFKNNLHIKTILTIARSQGIISGKPQSIRSMCLTEGEAAESQSLKIYSRAVVSSLMVSASMFNIFMKSTSLNIDLSDIEVMTDLLSLVKIGRPIE